MVAKTEIKDLSRMTLVLNGSDQTVEQAVKQVEDIVPVWAVLNYTGTPSVQREMLLVRVSTVPFHHHIEDNLSNEQAVSIRLNDLFIASCSQ